MSDILKTQRSFARKAEAHPDHRFDDLYHLIWRWDWLETALEHVLSNKGARTPGVDGITKDDLQTPEQQREFLELLQQELKTATYRPYPLTGCGYQKPTNTNYADWVSPVFETVWYRTCCE